MPSLDRRTFLGSLGAAAVGGALPPPLKALLVPHPIPARPAAPRVAVFDEPGFPATDRIRIAGASLREALADFELTFLAAGDLARLDPDSFDVFLNPYGSTFPKTAWPQIQGYLAAGGSWVNLGGTPLAVPVRRLGGTWTAEVRQTAYHKALGITQTFRVELRGRQELEVRASADRGRGRGPDAAAPRDWAADIITDLEVDTAYELYYRLTREPELPGEEGSWGPREAIIVPLASLYDGGEHAIAAPIVRIDRLQGPYAGGRWVSCNFAGSLTGKAVRALVEHAALGAHELRAQPSYACYREGETPAITVTLKSPRSARGANERCRLAVFDDEGGSIAEATLNLEGAGFVAAGSATLETLSGSTLRPGLYRVEATVEAHEGDVPDLAATTGFWVFDAALLAAGKPFSVDEHALLRDGQPYAVTGTSYMASDVHRTFLLEPNPHVWHSDFAAMKRAGVNMIRTGIWAGWKKHMPAVDQPNESALRALDAFMLTARRHDIPVIFTFFAFLPETWGGDNPYLDPSSVRAQQHFLSTIARRYREMNDVIWDLINEPSFCSPEHLWLTRPNYDQHERQAWRDWLRARYRAEDDSQLAEILAERWRTLPEDALELPRLEEFGDRNVFESNRPLKALDYRLFANDMFDRWARQMIAALREAGGPRQLITVGQDEGGTYERPGPMFHGESVAFTSNHTWWFNDDLLWDSIVTKTPDRPLLISETGVMFYEKIDGSAWRSEEQARDLLERKMALAVVSSAGFIEWAWNTNPYMPFDNEAAIGLLRADGSAKPELAAFRAMAAFARDSLRDLGPRERAPAVMIIPHSNLFSVRNQATDATRRAVRAMHYHCRVAMSAVSEYALDRLGYRPQLLVVPSPRVLREETWQRLLELAERGAILLVSGPIQYDEHWRPLPRLEPFGIQTELRPVAQEEDLEIDGAIYRLSYRGDKLERAEKAMIRGSSFARVVEIPIGRGRLIWSTLPVELAAQIGPTVALYRLALERAQVAPLFSLDEPDPGVLVYPAVYRDALLYAVVSELGIPASVRLTHLETSTPVEAILAPGRADLILIDRSRGAIRARYREPAQPARR